MVQFRPAAERGQYDPPVVEDISAGMAADSQAQINAMQRNVAQIERIGRMEVEEAQRTTTNDVVLSTLAQFSQTASKALKANQEQTAKDIQDGEDWNYLFGNDNPDMDIVEQVATDAADAQLSVTADRAKELDSVFGPSVGNLYYNRNAGIGRGLANERMMLINARNAYPSFLMSYRDSDRQITIPGLGTDSARNWLEMDDPNVIQAVHEQARYDFIKSRGLQYATKRGFVKELGKSMIAAEGNAATNIANNNATRNRKRVVEEYEGLATETAASDNYWDGDKYNQLVNDLANAGSGLTRGEADKVIAGAYISSYENEGDEDALNNLLLEYRRYNPDGTPVNGTRFGDTPALASDIRLAIDRVKRRDKAERNNQADQLLAEAQTALENAKSVEEANAIAAEYAPQIRQFSPDKADTFIKNQEPLRIDDNEALNAQYLLDEQANGFYRSDAFYADLFNNGAITRQQLKDLQKGNNAAKLPSEVTKGITSAGNVFKTRLAQFSGLKTDTSLLQPIFKAPTNRWTAMSVDDATELSKSYQRELQEVASNAYNNAPAGSTEAEKLKRAEAAIEQFNRTEVEAKNGAYNFSALQAINYNAADPGNEGVPLQFIDGVSPLDKAAATNLFNKIRNLPGNKYLQKLKIRDQMGDFTGQPVSWFNDYVPGTAPSTNMMTYYSARRGDKVFDQATTMDYQRTVVEEHRIHEDLQATAERLKVNPLMLLNQQLNAYGLTNAVVYPTDLTKETETKAIPEPQEGNWVGGPRPVSEQVFSGQGGAYDVADGQGGSGQMTPWQGAQWFMRAGFSPRGAAFLAGNIQTESNWIPDRPAWDDVGAPAGGLVSWRGQRLLQLQEEYGGKEVQYLTTEQQLNYMLKELSNPDGPYKVAYDIFRDPRSTQRDLIYASKVFWGYGVEGDRYQQAEALIQQMKARGQL